jgi:23S rRNA pseudouridine1911/1915/1917 synthase
MTFETPAAARGKRLDLLIQEQLSVYSRSRIQDWIRAGRVLVEGKVQKASYVLRGGESIRVDPAELVPLKAGPEDLPLDILYEDAAVIAVNKPAGLTVHAGAGIDAGTLVNRLVHHFGMLSSVGGDLRPGIVHRLDRYTSGVLLVARTDAAHQALATQFSSRTVEKIYLTLVHGSMELDRGRITTKIARDPVRRVRMTTRLGEGRVALTDWEVIRRLGKFTYLRVRIGTGRTHQIRVHLSSIGHPVVGDRLYGAPSQVEGMPPLERYFLHAHRITFTSPASGERVTVEAPLPGDLRDYMEGLTGACGIL